MLHAAWVFIWQVEKRVSVWAKTKTTLWWCLSESTILQQLKWNERFKRWCKRSSFSPFLIKSFIVHCLERQKPVSMFKQSAKWIFTFWKKLSYFLFGYRSQSYQTLISLFFRLSLRSLSACSIEKYCLYIKMAKLSNKKRKKSSFYKEKSLLRLTPIIISNVYKVYEKSFFSIT
jgi:hypothetical protein